MPKTTKTTHTSNPSGALLKRKHTFILEATFSEALSSKDAKRQIEDSVKDMLEDPSPYCQFDKVSIKSAQRFIDGKAMPLRSKLNSAKDAARTVELCVLDLKQTLEDDSQ